MRNRGPLWALVGAGTAFLLALVVFGAGTDTAVDTTPTSFADIAIPEPLAPTTTVARAEQVEPAPGWRVSASAPPADGEPAIPGLHGTIVAVVGPGDRGSTLTTIDAASWERGDTDLPRITFDFALDSSGQVLSYLAGARDPARWVVPITGLSGPHPLGSGTSSFVWSGDEPLTAAWLEAPVDGDGRRITVGRYTDDGMAPVADLGIATGALVGLTSDGYWERFEGPESPPSGLIAFGPRRGDEGWRIPADLVIPPPHGSAALMARLDISSWRWNFGLNEDGIVPLSWAPGDAGGEYGFAAFSPGGSRLAFIGGDSRGLSWAEVHHVAGGPTTRITMPYRVWDVGWSHDGRFVVMPGTDNRSTHVVVLLDSATNVLHAVEYDGWVQFAAVVDRETVGVSP